MQESRPKQQWEVHLMVAPPLQAGEPGGSGGGWGEGSQPQEAQWPLVSGEHCESSHGKGGQTRRAGHPVPSEGHGLPWLQFLMPLVGETAPPTAPTGK